MQVKALMPLLCTLLLPLLNCQNTQKEIHFDKVQENPNQTEDQLQSAIYKGVEFLATSCSEQSLNEMDNWGKSCLGFAAMTMQKCGYKDGDFIKNLLKTSEAIVNEAKDQPLNDKGSDKEDDNKRFYKIDARMFNLFAGLTIDKDNYTSIIMKNKKLIVERVFEEEDWGNGDFPYTLCDNILAFVCDTIDEDTLPKKHWKICRKITELRQVKGGGWSYNFHNCNIDDEGCECNTDENDVSGIQTCSSIINLKLCFRKLDPNKKSAEFFKTGTIRKALEYLDKNFVPSSNPGEESKEKGKKGLYDCEYQFLFFLNAAIGDSGIKKLNSMDWQDESVKYILKTQNKNGSWHSKAFHSDPISDTCFALLLLKKEFLTDLK